MTVSTCQVCLDSIEDGPDNALLTNWCGRNCDAQVCRQCMGRHVEVTLQQFYPGVLPRVRCPICLVPMHLTQWERSVPSTDRPKLVAKYEKLCIQACVLTPPCCHKTDYTHLPILDVSRKAKNPLKLLPSKVEKYKSLCVEFCRHKLEPRALLDYAFDTFGEEKAGTLVNELTLSRVVDPERRATLLLSLMYLRPKTKTNCCGADFCFNCKRHGHHDSCVEEFDEDTDLVRCRKCRALLLKVEGCDAVNCVCGFNMNWRVEQRLRRERKRGLLPVDIFNMPLTTSWLDFRQRQVPLLKYMRVGWLLKQVAACRPLLRQRFAVYVWRFRLRKVLATQLDKEWRARRVKVVDQHLASVKAVLHAALGVYIWRRRLSKALITMQSEMFWKAYRRWHPEELEAETDEASNLFSIAAYEDEE
ncbi:hypothetical protein KRP22_012498 [Phytophthora ramorum]|nr:hypothetical protein KRP22_13104 [Phytophthora ramorum]